MKYLKMISFLLSLTLIVFVLPAQNIFGQTKTDSTENNFSVEPAKSVTSHSVTIGGETIEYRAIAGIIPIYNDKGAPIAKFGYTAYLKKGVEDTTQRPIMFAFNGGPGSASIWLHMGALGPRRIKLNDPEVVPPSPYQLVNNQYSPLNVADVVMIDPVGTGYSEAAGEKKNAYFWGIEHDIHSISRFIIEFLETHNRINSPKYVLGESYGSFRLAGIANHLLEQGIALNGIAMVGTILDLRTIAFGPNDMIPYVVYLPTYAAIAWHHDKVDTSSDSLKSFIDQARNFTINEYAPALLKGSNISEAEREELINRLVQYIGLSEEFIDRANLRVEPSEFAKRILYDEQKIVGRYDGRYTGPALDPIAKYTFYDPSSSSIGPAFKTMFLKYYHQNLNFGKDRQYIFSASIPSWEWGDSGGWPTSPNTAPRLAQAMTLNPYLRVHIFNGYFDLATPFMGAEYTFSQMNVPESARDNIEFTNFKAGHMFYIRPSTLEKMHQGLTNFIK